MNEVENLVINDSDDEESDDEYCEGGCGKKEIWDGSEKNMCKDCDEDDEVWFVCGESFDYDDDGEADGSITDYLFKGDEKTAKERFTEWVNENHELVAAGKGKEMEYQRYELGYDTKDDTEYVEYAWWCNPKNWNDFDASY